MWAGIDLGSMLVEGRVEVRTSLRDPCSSLPLRSSHVFAQNKTARRIHPAEKSERTLEQTAFALACARTIDHMERSEPFSASLCPPRQRRLRAFFDSINAKRKQSPEQLTSALPMASCCQLLETAHVQLWAARVTTCSTKRRAGPPRQPRLALQEGPTKGQPALEIQEDEGCIARRLSGKDHAPPTRPRPPCRRRPVASCSAVSANRPEKPARSVQMGPSNAGRGRAASVARSDRAQGRAPFWSSPSSTKTSSRGLDLR
ncbi:hypothetical protein OH77DRAFT_131670 [Trametes cingulata]|nr:hypothetical protein OH77DRAFT_131670 [Trametes cingulata]